MKKLLIVMLLISLLIFAVGCDTELGHGDEDHDHDGDGIQDHAAEDHMDEHDDEHAEEIVIVN